MIMTTTPDSANAAAPKRHRSMIITSAGEDFGIDRVAEDLAMAFGGSVRREVIERVVLSAWRDLDGEVPPAALAEFTHRAARQRLADLRGHFRRRPTRSQPHEERTPMHKPVVTEQVLEVVGAALAHGSATRTDLLTAAVTARASTPVIEVLLGLPERSYQDLDQIQHEIAEPR